MADALPFDVHGLLLWEAAQEIVKWGYHFQVASWENADETKLHLDNPARRAGYDAKNVNIHVKCGVVDHYGVG